MIGITRRRQRDFEWPKTIPFHLALSVLWRWGKGRPWRRWRSTMQEQMFYIIAWPRRRLSFLSFRQERLSNVRVLFFVHSQKQSRVKICIDFYSNQSSPFLVLGLKEVQQHSDQTRMKTIVFGHKGYASYIISGCGSSMSLFGMCFFKSFGCGF